MRVSRHSGSFPRFTWVTCECGCGYEGEDEVAQHLIEEALLLRLELEEDLEKAQDAAEQPIADAIHRREEMKRRLGAA